MNATSQFFKKFERGEHTPLHEKAKTIVGQLPILRMPINATSEDPGFPVAEEIVDDGIDSRHVIELAHLSHDPGIGHFGVRSYCVWADCLAAEWEYARWITDDMDHEPFCALYVIRVYAPNWSMPDERVTPKVSKPKRATSVRECSLAFEVKQGQFAMIPISLNTTTQMLK